jgi:Rps23 Pro-64 3,4-dihydroxylase Tpa1-like proline 4-hydroxylase
MNKLTIDPVAYRCRKPFPYAFQDNFLSESYAHAIQTEILDLSGGAWDRYNNPFEQKYTLRDKYGFPPYLKSLFEQFQSPEFVSSISEIVGYELFLDTTRNFWGVHIYEPGDYLDIHVDAGYHPTLGMKKQVTLGLYLSLDWKSEYGCELEIWNGSNCATKNASLSSMADKIEPMYNRMIMFTCDDYSWHGNPTPVVCPATSRRIFLTISYLSKNCSDENKRTKAFFIARPTDPQDSEKDRLRILRADPELYKTIYRTDQKTL